MYTGTMKDYHSPTMDRAVDMRKVIRFLTCAMAGNGYLNFTGNEFGHGIRLYLPCRCGVALEKVEW